jgi:hypothetical protein
MREKDMGKRITTGHDWSEVVGEYLRTQGIPCEVPPLTFAKTEEEREIYAVMEKDIILWDGSVLEVKSQSREFGAQPTQYAWDHFIVDTIGYFLKDVTPIAYVFVSQPTGAMLTLNTNTEASWWEETITDQRDGVPSRSLISAKANLRTMAALIAHLRGRYEASLGNQPF